MPLRARPITQTFAAFQNARWAATTSNKLQNPADLSKIWGLREPGAAGHSAATGEIGCHGLVLQAVLSDVAKGRTAQSTAPWHPAPVNLLGGWMLRGAGTVPLIVHAPTQDYPSPMAKKGIPAKPSAKAPGGPKKAAVATLLTVREVLDEEHVQKM
jgi:hypothetical protein